MEFFPYLKIFLHSHAQHENLIMVPISRDSPHCVAYVVKIVIIVGTRSTSRIDASAPDHRESVAQPLSISIVTNFEGSITEN